MKLRFALLTLLAGLALAPGARAAGTPWIGLTAGVGMPTGHFGDVANSGWNAGLTGDYALSERFALGGELSWHSFGGSSDYEKLESVRHSTPVNATNTLIPVLVHVRLLTPWGSDLHPYGVVGVGLYHRSSKLEYSGGSSSASDTKFGFSLGAGVRRKTSNNVELGAEARYHWISDSPDSFNLLTLRGQMLFAFGG